MLLSVITPTHNGCFLTELWNSLKQQTYQNFEWVVCPNGKDPEAIEKLVEAFGDPRIKVFKPHPWLGNSIGALKGFGFGKAIGDVLVEVDHDDTLHPNCLQRIHAATENYHCRFVYSRCLG